MYVHEQCPGTLHQQIQNKGEDQNRAIMSTYHARLQNLHTNMHDQSIQRLY